MQNIYVRNLKIAKIAIYNYLFQQLFKDYLKINLNQQNLKKSIKNYKFFKPKNN